jgi:hypothetical protein
MLKIADLTENIELDREAMLGISGGKRAQQTDKTSSVDWLGAGSEAFFEEAWLVSDSFAFAVEREFGD